MFHQRQKHWLCGLHTVNNLLQKELYTRQSMNLLCEELTPSTFWGNIHYNKFGYGDYDINILTYALQKQGMDIVWKDSHRACTIEDFQSDNMVGIIVNQRNILCFFESRHWFAILRQEKQDGIEFWNLNSKLQTPSQMGQEKLIDFLENIQNQGSQILYVKKKQFN